MAEWQRAEKGPADIESILKGIGMCVWSWPMGAQEHDAFQLVSMCTSGQSLTLPHPELGYDDQPNIFYEYLQIFLKAKAEYQEKYRGATP